MVPIVETPDGQALPFIFAKPHRVDGVMVPEPMLYPSRGMLEASILALPKGHSSSLAAMRADLAEAHGTASTCPVTTQRLFRDIAETAFEAWQRGDKEAITPFWRMVDPERPSTRQLPGGAEFVRARRLEEQIGR